VAPDAADRTRQYRDALYESLAGAEPAASDASPLILLGRLAERGRPLASEAPAASLIATLGEVAGASDIDAAVALAETRFESPAAFREAISFGRCLARDAGQTLRLSRERTYLEGGFVPALLPDLLTDREAVLDAATFTALWREPARLEWMLNVIAIWRREYAAAYAAQHGRHQAAIAALAEGMDALLPRVAAVERLNGLDRLGAPLAVAALAHFHELERLFPCSLDARELAEALADSPLCPLCSFRLGDRAPTAEARRVAAAIERALAGQQGRLARRVVSRLLDRPAASTEERLRRFIEVVQASDLAGLALILDDSLVEFLRSLLEAPAAGAGVVDRLARAYPDVTEANLDAVIAEFRRLLEAELQRAAGPVHLASERP
jgi:hypothetical protein